MPLATAPICKCGSGYFAHKWVGFESMLMCLNCRKRIGPPVAYSEIDAVLHPMNTKDLADQRWQEIDAITNLWKVFEERVLLLWPSRIEIESESTAPTLGIDKFGHKGNRRVGVHESGSFMPIIDCQVADRIQMTKQIPILLEEIRKRISMSSPEVLEAIGNLTVGIADATKTRMP